MNHTFHTAGIGASAGGIEALTEHFNNIPTQTGIAFAVLTHLLRTRNSQL